MASAQHIPDLKKIKITDSLFGSYASLVASSMLPYQWGILNGGYGSYHSIDNFRIAAGELQGKHNGPVFVDTDAYKWLEAVAYCTESGGGEKFLPLADGLIGLIGRAQQPDGYLDTYYTVVHPEEKWTNLTEGHELYNAGHLIEAAVAYFQATGKSALLDIARRLADLICEKFGPEEGKLHGYPGHQEIELALVKLFRVTGTEKYLSLAKYFIDHRGEAPNYFLEELRRRKGDRIFPELGKYDPKYSQSHLPPRDQSTAEGHAVRAMYMYSAMADLASYGDESLRSACVRLWDNITRTKLYITGGIGSSGIQERFTVDYDLPNDRMYCESCASIGLMMFGQRMAALTRDASYYDAVERALCNCLLSGLSVSGDRYFYVNPLEVWPANCLEHTSLAHVKPVRQPWFDVACCPPNIARTLASLGQYVYAEDSKSLYVNLLISSEIQTSLQGNDVFVSLESHLISEGSLSLTVRSDGSRPFTLRLRLPGWLENPSFLLDGARIAPAVENGYAVLAVSRSGTQTFTLRGSVTPRFVASDLNVRADVGKLALSFGPFVYCLEEADNGANLATLFVSPDSRITAAPPLKGMPGSLPTLKVEGRRLAADSPKDSLLTEPRFRWEKAELTAVPYCLWSNRTPGEMRVWINAQI